jgi:hypothetical protein
MHKNVGNKMWVVWGKDGRQIEIKRTYFKDRMPK